MLVRNEVKGLNYKLGLKLVMFLAAYEIKVSIAELLMGMLTV